jgi:hypothetical protein
MMNDSISPTGCIERKTYDVSVLRDEYDDWDSLSDDVKLSLLRDTMYVSSEEVYNVTTNRFHEYMVDNLDPGNTSAEANLEAISMGLGTDSASGTSPTDTDLNNRVFEKAVTDHADNGAELLASTFISSTEANGETLNEIGLYTGNPNNLSSDPNIFLINHATFSDVVKDNQRTITFDISLSFSDS